MDKQLAKAKFYVEKHNGIISAIIIVTIFFQVDYY
jgi:hypothetical protein